MILLILFIFVSITIAHLQFFSPSSKVTVTDVSKIDAIGNGAFTISLWFQGIYSGNYGSPVALLSTRKSSNYGSILVGFVPDWKTYSPFRPFIQLDYNLIDYTAPQIYTDGNWQHFVITRDIKQDGNCYLKYYINATNIYTTGPTTSNYCNADVSGGATTLYIGDDVATTGFIGNISQVSIWNIALTDNQIDKMFRNVYINDSYISYAGLLHYYPMNEKSFICEQDGIIHDVYNGNNGHLSSKTDPKCTDGTRINYTNIVSTKQDKYEQSNNSTLIIIIIVIILLVIIGVCVYYYNYRRKSQSKMTALHAAEADVISNENQEGGNRLIGNTSRPGTIETETTDNGCIVEPGRAINVNDGANVTNTILIADNTDDPPPAYEDVEDDPPPPYQEADEGGNITKY